MIKQLLVDAVGLLGLGCVVVGVHQIYEPAAFIVAGAALVAWAYKASSR